MTFCRSCSLALLSALLLAVSPSGAFAAADDLRKPGVSLATDRRASVLVLYPELFVGRLDSDEQQMADPVWTESAHANLASALAAGPVGHAVDLRFMTQAAAESSPAVARGRAAFLTISSDIIFSVPQGTAGTATARRGHYDYTMGSEVVAQLKALHGEADYALFIQMHDGYATRGHFLTSTTRAMLAPVGTPDSVRHLPPHHGNAMLIDLRDGAVVWFHGDGAFGGDLRNQEGAARRLSQAMSNFPIAPSRRAGR
jgi:hypothetical protein